MGQLLSVYHPGLAMGQLLIGRVFHRKGKCIDERGNVSMNQVVRLEKAHPWEHCGEIASHSLSYSSSCAVSMAEIGFCSRIAALRLQKESSTEYLNPWMSMTKRRRKVPRVLEFSQPRKKSLEISLVLSLVPILNINLTYSPQLQKPFKFFRAGNHIVPCIFIKGSMGALGI